MPILHYSTLNRDDEQYATLRDRWCTDYSSPCPDDISAHKQSVWDKPLIHRETSSLIDSLSEDYDKARFRAVAARHSSDWLLALPITTCGLRLVKSAIRHLFILIKSKYTYTTATSKAL